MTGAGQKTNLLNVTWMRLFRSNSGHCLTVMLALGMGLGVFCSPAQGAKSVVPSFKASFELERTQRNGQPAVRVRSIAIRVKKIRRFAPAIRCDQRSCKRLLNSGRVIKRRSRSAIKYSNVNWVMTEGQSLTIALNARARIGRFMQFRIASVDNLTIRRVGSGCTRKLFRKRRCPRSTAQPPPEADAPVARCLSLNNHSQTYDQSIFATSFQFAPINPGCSSDITHSWSGGINTLFSNANGTFGLRREGWLPRGGYNLSPDTTRTLPAEIDGDGSTDLIHIWGSGINSLVSNLDGSYRLIREGWLPRAGYNMSLSSSRVLGGDVDGDGDTDLVHVWTGGLNTMTSNRDGTFSMRKEGWLPKSGYVISPTGQVFLISDWSGDGRADIVHVWSDGLNMLRSAGDGTYQLVNEGWLPRAGYPTSIASSRFLAGDVNGDGAGDLVHVWSGGVNTMVSRLDGTFSLVREGWLPRDGYATAPTTTRYFLADLNGDGAADLVHVTGSGITSMFSNRDGTFGAARENWLPRAGYGTN